MKLSIRTLADYMTASPTKQRTVLFNAKYEDQEEPQAKIHYYLEALKLIKDFHRGAISQQKLIDESDRLENQASLDTNSTRANRLKNNARVLRDYEKHMAQIVFQIQARVALLFPASHPSVKITASPDIVAQYKNRKRYIRFDFSARGLPDEVRKIMLQGTYEAAHAMDPQTLPGDVLLFHVGTGSELKGARMGSRLRKDIDSTCSNIAAIWPTL